MKILKSILLLLFLFNVSFGYSQEQKKYTNPVIDSVYADPSVLLANDGFYYVYATNTIIGNEHVNFALARSKDLVHWTFLGDAMPVKPIWANQTSKLWAPHVIYDDVAKKYFMYFSSGNNKDEGMCIGIATSESPQGPFTDKGEPLICGESFINIDPMAFDDSISGKHLLYWGSGFKPLKVQELTDDRMHFAEGSAPKDIVYTGKENKYTNLLEAPWVTYRDGYYYIFYSGDNCCGERASYAVMVSRSKHPFGPFISLGESNGTGSSVILEQKDFWCAPGHNAIAIDKAGNSWIIYHAINPDEKYLKDKDRKNVQDRRVMLLDRIYYKDGWPYVNEGKPSTSPVTAPVVE